MTSQKPTTPWAVGQAADSLNELAYFERAAAHVLCGWLPKISDMAFKVELGQHAYLAMDRATQLRTRLGGLLKASAVELPVKQGWQLVMKRVDTAPDTAGLLSGLYQVVLPHLSELYRLHASCAEPVGDRPSLRLITSVLPDIEAQLAWGHATLLQTQLGPEAQAFLAEVETLWKTRSQGPELPVSDSLWKPLDRVLKVSRPTGLERCETGSMGLLTVDSVREPRDVAIFLHSDLDEEYTTLELMARNSYEHPDMPWQFHVDMTRQVSDEARHALLMSRLLEDRGFHYGSFAINTGSYDWLYEFGPCETGSRKELLWRMLIRQTFMEGLALDSLAHNVKRREAADQHDIARALDYILRDEVFHAGCGVRWSAFLIGDDRRAVLQERYEAMTYYARGVEARRANFVENNLEKAMGELAILEEGKRRRGGKLPDRPLNRAGRRQAGFNDDDILQVLSWGYATE